MISIAIDTLIFIAFVAFALKRMMTYLLALQQDDYDNERLLKWMGTYKAFDKKLTALLLIIGAANLLTAEPLYMLVFKFFIFATFIIFTLMEADPRKKSKKKLVMTQRATRIFVAGMIPLSLVAASSFLLPFTWHWIIFVQAIPFFLIGGNMLLQPYEARIQKQFWNEAHNKVLSLNPKVIGITGSFGKTSVKHILGHILKMHAPTLITPGSVNTPMGITRIIREQLNESHKYFVVEMGAYGPGSIQRLCELTPPDMGLITAIGHAHYERFKTLDAVAQTKFELAQNTLNKDGKVIVHESTLRFDYSKEMRDANAKSFIAIGEPTVDRNERQANLTGTDVHIEKIEQTIDGVVVVFTWKGEKHHIEAPLFGLHHGHNLTLAYVTALELGIEIEAIDAALKSMPQIQHRLEVKKLPDDRTIIDDAFNSNPIGFRSAIDLMYMLKNADKENPGRGILVTPGMIEMGKAHNDAHEKIGQYAGQMCDIAVVVQGERIPSFIKAFKENGEGKTIIEVGSFTEASAWVEKHKQANDVVLIENDLPDLYERVPNM
ncbi:MAG: UDP-N-acetylmuramoyl-tripeptide--D-alanyl-D-alanine ligase [Pseudomonadota bacterium]